MKYLIVLITLFLVACTTTITNKSDLCRPHSDIHMKKVFQGLTCRKIAAPWNKKEKICFCAGNNLHIKD